MCRLAQPVRHSGTRQVQCALANRALLRRLGTSDNSPGFIMQACSDSTVISEATLGKVVWSYNACHAFCSVLVHWQGAPKPRITSICMCSSASACLWKKVGFLTSDLEFLSGL